MMMEKEQIQEIQDAILGYRHAQTTLEQASKRLREALPEHGIVYCDLIGCEESSFEQNRTVWTYERTEGGVSVGVSPMVFISAP